MPIHKSLNQDFFKKWSPEMAYILGFFTADGCMIKNKRGAHFIEFHITDLNILKKIRNILGSNHKIAVRRRNDRWRTGYRFQIGSKEIFNDLINLGLTPRKSLILNMPKIPVCYLASFVRGYFDGDGCVSIGKYWRKDRSKFQWEISSRFTSGSKVFLEELLRILRKFADVEGGFISNKIGSYDLVFSRHDSLALFRFIYDNKEDLFLERKHDLFERGFKNLNLGT